MKRIIFIRHAKSSWTSTAKRDYDRPLNDRGKQDAPAMAERLRAFVPKISGIIKSPSKRTSQTAKYFMESYDLKELYILDEPSLYHGSLYDILDAVQSLPDNWSTVLLFGHNPGMTSTAEYFGMSNVENVPTCGITIVESTAKDWASLNNENSKVIGYEYPKKYSV